MQHDNWKYKPKLETNLNEAKALHRAMADALSQHFCRCHSS
jgi:hypothetical protein